LVRGTLCIIDWFMRCSLILLLFRAVMHAKASRTEHTTSITSLCPRSPGWISSSAPMAVDQVVATGQDVDLRARCAALLCLALSPLTRRFLARLCSSTAQAQYSMSLPRSAR
jgi:hypothetical protein